MIRVFSIIGIFGNPTCSNLNFKPTSQENANEVLALFHLVAVFQIELPSKLHSFQVMLA